VAYLSTYVGVSWVMENGGSEEEAIAALLHDSIEDAQDYRAVQVEPARPERLKPTSNCSSAPSLSIVRQFTDDEYLPTASVGKGHAEKAERKTAYLDAAEGRSLM